MKTDVELRLDVLDELAWDPRMHDTEIAVVVKDGIVTLSGHVTSLVQRCAAEQAAERVSGVRAVADGLLVRLAPEDCRSDADLQQAAECALCHDAEVPPGRVRAHVARGWLTLQGSVDWHYQQRAALHAIQRLRGVKGLTDLVIVKPRVPTPEAVRAHIEAALRRSASLDARWISVQTNDGAVVLRGTVRSWLEREDAERAAWSAPGVREVADELFVIT